MSTERWHHEARDKAAWPRTHTTMAASARAAAERIKLRMARAAQDIIETGRELVEQKESLGRGNFLPWIKDEFGMSEDTAQNFMRISSQFGENTERVRYLSYKALIALSSPSTPGTVRTEVLDRAAKGEGDTLEGWLAYGAALNEGRTLHPGDREFGRWVAENVLSQVVNAPFPEEQTAAMWAALGLWGNEENSHCWLQCGYRIFSQSQRW